MEIQRLLGFEGPVSGRNRTLSPGVRKVDGQPTAEIGQFKEGRQTIVRLQLVISDWLRPQLISEGRPQPVLRQRVTYLGDPLS